MARLTGEARDRARAMSLWLVVGIVLLGVVVVAFATFVGFAAVRPTSITAVVVPDPPGTEIVVHYRAGSPGCDELDRIDVAESATSVRLDAHLRRRRSLHSEPCADIDEIDHAVVVLDSPLDGRVVRDGDRVVPVSVSAG